MAEAADFGLYEQALGLGRLALGLLEDLPENDARRRMRAQLFVSLARVHWLAAGLSPELSLDHATRLLDAASELFRSGDPLGDAASTDALRARVLYDVGSPEALEQALEVAYRRQQFGQVLPGRYWLDARGIGGNEGGPARLRIGLPAGGGGGRGSLVSGYFLTGVAVIGN